jgi:hypothetical protein
MADDASLDVWVLLLLAGVHGRMVCLGHENQILDRIVERVVIPVVNIFVGIQGSAENAFHDDAMGTPLLSVHAHETGSRMPTQHAVSPLLLGR